MRGTPIVSTQTWTRRWHGGKYIGDPMPVQPSGDGMGISIMLPVSAHEDPNSDPPWEGYLLGENRSHPISITGSMLVYQIRCIAPLAKRFNYMRDANNVGNAPLAFHPFLKKNAMDFNGDGDRWWSNTTFPLVAGIDSGIITLKVPLDPSEWYNSSGVLASSGYLSDFQKTLKNPSFYGGTFGGGFFAGHGGNVFGGPAKFCVYRMYTV